MRSDVVYLKTSDVSNIARLLVGTGILQITILRITIYAWITRNNYC